MVHHLHHMILSSNFFIKSLLKFLHLKRSANLLFRRFIPLCVTISNFLFKQRLHVSITRFIGVHHRTILQAIFVLLFLDLRFNTSFESIAKWLFMIGELFFKSVFTTTLVIFFVIIKFIWVQIGLINNIFGLAFFV